MNFTEEAINDYWPCMNVLNLFYALDMSTFKWDELCVKNVIEINDNNFLFFAENNFTITSKLLNDTRWSPEFSFNSVYYGKSMLIIINDKEGNQIKTFTITSFINYEDIYGDGDPKSIRGNNFELCFEWDEVKYSFYKKKLCLLIKEYSIFFDLEKCKTIKIF